jgi:radical SAM protein with 4Fe4S-binding SPASM domain
VQRKLEDNEESWRQGLASDPKLSVNDWADKHQVLSSVAASEPGQWSTGRTPYLKEIMEVLSAQDRTERVVFMKGAHLGGTETGLNWLGYVVHHAPGPMLMVQPTVETASRCFVTDKNTLTVDLAGNILTCQNFEARAVDEDSGEPHCLGKIEDLAPGTSVPVSPAVRMTEKQRTKCSRCLVLSVCRGGCPYSPEAYEDYNCAAAYYQYLPVVGLALHHLTGKLLMEVKPWTTHKEDNHA